LRPRALDLFGKLDIDAFFAQGAQTEIAFIVVAEASDISGFSAQTPQTDGRRGDFAAGRLNVIFKLDFRVKGRLFGHDN
jgi:hypothetical protein